MDGFMDMKRHYHFANDESADIVGSKGTFQPFSMLDLKSCPMYRKPLLSLNRYGQIVRRAWIDQMTKRFIVRANHAFVPLTKRLDQFEQEYDKSQQNKNAQTEDAITDEDKLLLEAFDQRSWNRVRITGTPDEQISQIMQIMRFTRSNRKYFTYRREICEFRSMVDEAEQPISQIYNLVEDARRQRTIQSDMVLDLPSMLQVRHCLLATILLLRCDYFIVQWFISRCAEMIAIDAEFACNRQSCVSLIEESQMKHQIAHEVEGYLYWVRFAILELRYTSSL